MTVYRFKDGMGDVVDEREFADHEAALAWVAEDDEIEDDIMRVEFLDDRGDWRWAGPVEGR